MLKNELSLILLQIDENMDDTPKEIVDKICSDIVNEGGESIEMFTNDRIDGEEEHPGTSSTIFKDQH